MILFAIIACEIAFWVLIVVGLVLRYPARMPRAGLVALALVPVVDVMLLAFTAINLRSGATATVAHALAALYLGFSVAYGHRLITWADTRFAHRYANGPAPVKLHGTAYTRLCWGDVRRTAIAVTVASAVTWVLVAWVGDPVRTATLETTYRWSAIILGIETLVAVTYTIWPRRAPSAG